MYSFFPMRCLIVAVFYTGLTPLSAQTLNLFDVSQDAGSGTAYYNGQFNYESINTWNGSYNLGVTGTTSGGSNLPNPGRESSGSGSFFADHSFSSTSWSLSGWAQGSIDAGLGNAGSIYSTIAQTTILSSSLYIYVDTPFTISLTGSVFESFTGIDPNMVPDFTSQGSITLFAEILDGQLVNQNLASWGSSPENPNNGGTYTGTFNSGVFRLHTAASALLSSNVPDAYGTHYSSYDAQLSIGAVPEPGSALLLGVASLYPLLRRRRQLQPRTEN
jgi:hypothetical protein